MWPVFSLRELLALQFYRKDKIYKLSKTLVELFIFHRLSRGLK